MERDTALSASGEISYGLQLRLISLCLTTKFLYDIGCKGCQRAEIGQKCEQNNASAKNIFLIVVGV